MNKFFICFDVGGTDIKLGLIDRNGEVLCKAKTPTKNALKDCSLGKALIDFAQKFCVENGFNFSKALGIGIGLPGLVDINNGILKYAGNLKINNYPIINDMKKYTSLDIKISNDADLCALAECKKGSGKAYNSFVLIAIGTGIGAGIVLNGKLFTNSFSGELGHMKTSSNKLKCHCGEFGCYETLASTKALINQTKQAMIENPNSKMWKTYSPETVTGKTAFEYKNDAAANKVLKNYIQNLGDGIINIVNIFTPEAIILGGAISNQKENLIVPLEEYVNKHIFARLGGFKVKIVPASATSDAGIIGARYLF